MMNEGNKRWDCGMFKSGIITRAELGVGGRVCGSQQLSVGLGSIFR